jgi:preprotein translocase subunit YajC
MNNGFHKGDQVTIGHSGRVGRVLAVTDAALYVKWNDNPTSGGSRSLHTRKVCGV